MFSAPDGTTQMDIRMENTDVREVGFHPPALNQFGSVVEVSPVLTY